MERDRGRVIFALGWALMLGYLAFNLGKQVIIKQVLEKAVVYVEGGLWVDGFLGFCRV
jgi:hypothetical protein